jgi:hypothetical protein
MTHLTGLLGVTNEMETFGKVWSRVQTQSFVISLWGCGMGKQVVGLKGNSNRETKVKCQHSSAGLAKFLWVSAAVCLPRSLWKVANFSLFTGLNFSRENPIFNYIFSHYKISGAYISSWQLRLFCLTFCVFCLPCDKILMKGITMSNVGIYLYLPWEKWFN